MGIPSKWNRLLYIGIDQPLATEKIAVTPTLLEDQLSINNPTGLRLQFYLLNNLHGIVLRNEIAPFENKVIAGPLLPPGFILQRLSPVMECEQQNR